MNDFLLSAINIGILVAIGVFTYRVSMRFFNWCWTLGEQLWYIVARPQVRAFWYIVRHFNIVLYKKYRLPKLKEQMRKGDEAAMVERISKSEHERKWR